MGVCPYFEISTFFVALSMGLGMIALVGSGGSRESCHLYLLALPVHRHMPVRRTVCLQLMILFQHFFSFALFFPVIFIFIHICFVSPVILVQSAF